METGSPVCLESNRSFYLTLISMIQSLALGYLLTTLDLATIPTTTYVLQVTATLLVIVLVWHEYAIGTMIYVWVIDLWDSAIPFAFGLAQFFLITALSRKGWGNAWWFWALASFGVVSLLAFLNQYSKASKHAVNQVALQSASKRSTVIYVAVSCITFIGEGVGATFADRGGWAMLGLVLASTLTIVGFAGRGLFVYPKLMAALISGQSQAPVDVPGPPPSP